MYDVVDITNKVKKVLTGSLFYNVYLKGKKDRIAEMWYKPDRFIIACWECEKGVKIHTSSKSALLWLSRHRAQKHRE